MGQTRPPPQARARGPQPQSSAGLRRSRNRSEHKAPSRPASGSRLCPLLPSPSRAAQPETVPGRGRRGGVPHPARFSDPRALATRPRRPALCCPPQLRGPGAARAEVLRASPIQPGASFFACSRPPLPARAAQDTRVGDSQLGGPRHSLVPPKGPAASAAPEPGTRPSWEGRPGIGTHSPSPATSHPAVGEGAVSPPFHWAPGPVPALRLGRVPAPNTLQKPGKKCWARP